MAINFPSAFSFICEISSKDKKRNEKRGEQKEDAQS